MRRLFPALLLDASLLVSCSSDGSKEDTSAPAASDASGVDLGDQRPGDDSGSTDDTPEPGGEPGEAPDLALDVCALVGDSLVDEELAGSGPFTAKGGSDLHGDSCAWTRDDDPIENSLAVTVLSHYDEAYAREQFDFVTKNWDEELTDVDGAEAAASTEAWGVLALKGRYHVAVKGNVTSMATIAEVVLSELP